MRHVPNFDAFARRPSAGQGCNQIATSNRLTALHGKAPRRARRCHGILDAAEGPFQTGEMGFYEEQILPRVTDRALRGQEAARLRARVTAGLSGEVLEVGFGSGLNMPYYPAAVTRVRAVDPSAVARKLAAERVAASTVPVEYIGADAQALRLADASVDHVVSVLTLCTIPAADRALAEIRRVLRPAGAFHFMEH